MQASAHKAFPWAARTRPASQPASQLAREREPGRMGMHDGMRTRPRNRRLELPDLAASNCFYSYLSPPVRSNQPGTPGKSGAKRAREEIITRAGRPYKWRTSVHHCGARQCENPRRPSRQRGQSRRKEGSWSLACSEPKKSRRAT